MAMHHRLAHRGRNHSDAIFVDLDSLGMPIRMGVTWTALTGSRPGFDLVDDAVDAKNAPCVAFGG